MTKQELEVVLDRPIAFYPVFAKLSGSITSALMLSQLNYWSQRTKDPNGWIFKTVEEMTEETMLSRFEQESARRRLLQCRFIEVQRRGLPAKLYYRIRWDEVLSKLSSSLKSSDLDRGILADKIAENQRSTSETTSEITHRERRGRSKLAEDFTLTEEQREYAYERHVNPDIELARFKDYYLSAGTRWERWDLVWQRWCRNVSERSNGQGTFKRQKDQLSPGMQQLADAYEEATRRERTRERQNSGQSQGNLVLTDQRPIDPARVVRSPKID